MGRLLGSLFGLRRDERTLALWMAVYHVLLLVSLYLLKPVRDSLFLSSRGAAELPFVFILTTVVVVPVAALHTRAGDRFRLGGLIDGGSLLLVLSLVGLRGLLGVSGEWSAYVLYAWVSIYGLLITSQFWLMANALFTSSQSKRVFTVLSAGAILGAIVGGQVTSLLVETVGMSSTNLLWVASGVLFVATGLARWIRTRHVPLDEPQDAPEEAAKSEASALSIIRDSRHIQLIVGILALTVVVTTLVDYQFKTVAARAYPTEAGLTSFMGQFYGGVSVIALIVQFLLAPRLMRVVGIGGALSVLPGILALGSLGMLVVPGLLAGIFLRGSGQSLKHSIDKTGRELLFVPVPLPKKKRVKVFIDVFVDQGAQGLGGVLLLGLVTSLGLSVQMLSLVILALIAVWGTLAYRARQSYVDQFRTQLRNQEASYEAPEEAEETAVDTDELLDSLCSRTETDALQALDQLEEGSAPVPVDALLCLLDHPAPAVRAQTLRVLRARRVEGVGEAVAEALRDPDPDVQVAAARYLYCQATDRHTERIRQGLNHEDPQIQAATLGLIATDGDPDEYELVSESLLRRLIDLEGETGTQTRTHVARILGVLDRSYRNDFLHRLLRDDTPEVVRTAIEAAGNTNDRSFLFPLIRQLGEDAYASTARQALSAFDPPVLGTLYDYLVDPQTDPDARVRIPSIFVNQSGSFAVASLVRGLRKVEVPVRHAIAQALSKLHQAVDASPSDPDVLDAVIKQEAAHYAALGQIQRLLQQSAEHPVPIDPATLQPLRQEGLERIFRLLGLRYNQRDIYDAYLGVTSPDPTLRDSAIEFVDNLVDYNTRRFLLPLLDDPEGRHVVEVGAKFFDRSLRDWDAATDYLRTADDPRLTDLLEEGPDADVDTMLDPDDAPSASVAAPGSS
ncbi:Npt1/Npt2 family nucleotide transporter [Salinibacter altiplanensis]|uniref:Npt1/Npt2 family nucleotide transporter n=1 Tax=Salinibacter altiplanensis TaxID=1803181 RepID=UPI000C9F41A6|nr:Npt1/Npt2 family nucleotide transporter [Salinibacter altiplanensis]